MLNLTTQVPQETGFYFMTYYANLRNSAGLVDVSLKQLKPSSNDVVVVEDAETLGGYPDSGFSAKTPDYVTKKFAKLVNSYIVAQNFNVKIGMAVNESVGFDDSFAVFIRSNIQPEITIVTQYMDGRVEQSFVRGVAAMKTLSEFL